MEEKNYITEEKKEDLIKELDYLKTTRRKEILDALQSAKAMGDLSENAEYHQARNKETEDRDSSNRIHVAICNCG